MGPSTRHKNTKPFIQIAFSGAGVVCGLLLCSSIAFAQSDTATSVAPPRASQEESRNAGTSAGAPTQDSKPIANISGTVLDATGAPLSGAKVRLTRLANVPVVETTTAQD